MCSCQNVYPNIYASVLISHMICEKNSYSIRLQRSQQIILAKISDNACFLSVEANSVDPDQTDWGLHCLAKRLQSHFSRGQK